MDRNNMTAKEWFRKGLDLIENNKYEKAIELPFTPPEAYVKLGICLVELGKHEEGLENLERGVNYVAHEPSEDVSQKELLILAKKYISEVKNKKEKK